jgi:hypothetical protein
MARARAKAGARTRVRVRVRFRVRVRPPMGVVGSLGHTLRRGGRLNDIDKIKQIAIRQDKTRQDKKKGPSATQAATSSSLVQTS